MSQSFSLRKDGEYHMADATITVGAVLDGSFSNIESTILSKIKSIESNATIKVKAEVDTSAVSKQMSGMNLGGSGGRSTLVTQMTSVNKSMKAMDIGSKQYAAALGKINTAQKQIEVNSAKWTKAQTGRSSALYNEYTSQSHALQKLSADMQAGSVSQKQFSERFSKIQTVMKESEMGIRAAGEATKSFGSRIQGSMQKFGQYFGVSRIIYAAVRSVKAMANASIEVESAMNRIQIVTGASDREMSSFFTTASTQAKELGKSITDVAASIETFSRLGYNLKDASQLSKYATIMSNVGDVDVDSATTGITSIIKGYSLSPKDAERVSDVLVTVGKNYAISAEELMTAFERGGAALAASGTDFEKSAALFAATNASLQNAQMTGTMWKTVSARIRGATTELEEMGEDTTGLAEGLSKYRGEIMALSGVDIMKNENEYKDMYDIFTELASVWDNINGDEAKARVAEILGGTRQLSGIMSTITNIKDAEGAYSDAMNAAGESARANDKYMETTAAHIGQLKATFQEFSSDLFDSSFLKGLVDAGNIILKILDTIIDKVGILGTVGIGAGLFKLIKGMKSAGGLRGLGGMLGLVSGAKAAETTGRVMETSGELVKGADGAYAMSSASSAASASGSKLLGVLEALGPAGLAAAAAGVAAGVALYRMATQYKRAKQEATDAIDEYNNTESELSSLNSELDATRSKLSELEGKKLSPLEKEEYSKLKAYNLQLEQQKSTLENIQAIQRENAAQQAIEALSTNKYWNANTDEYGRGKNSKRVSAGGGHTAKSRSAYGETRESGTVIDQIESGTKRIQERQKALDKQRKAEAKAASKARAQQKKLDTYSDAAKKKVGTGLKTSEDAEAWQEEHEKYVKDKKKFDRYQQDLKNAQGEISKTQRSIAEVQKEQSSAIDEAAPMVEAIRSFDPENEIVKKYDKAVNAAKSSKSSLESFFSERSEIKEYLQGVAESGGDLEDALNKIGVSIDDLGIEKISELQDYFDETAKSAKEAENAVGSFRKGVEDVDAAVESENQDKSWKSIQSAYKSAKDLLKEGQTGTDDFQTMAQYLSPKDIAASAERATKRTRKRTGKGSSEAARQYEAAFRAAMKTADRWFGEDETQSMKNFVKDFESKGLMDVSTDPMGRWTLDTKFNTTAEAAKKFNMSVESVETMLKSLESYGYDFSGITKSGEAISEYESALNGLKETYSSMQDGIGKDKLKGLIDSFEGEYAGFKDDLSNLSKEQVVHIKFEYDLAQLQSEIDNLKQSAEEKNTADAWSDTLAKQRTYIQKGEHQLGFDKDGVELPVVYKANQQSIDNLYKQLEGAKGQDRIDILAQISNKEQIQQDIINSISSTHPEITPDTDPSVINETLKDYDGTITITADVDKEDVSTMLQNMGDNAKIKYTAVLADGTEQAMIAWKDQSGTVHYQADASNAQPSTKETTVDGTVNYGVGTIAKPSSSETTITGKINYALGSVAKVAKTIAGGGGGKKGDGDVNGTAHHRGTAFAHGNWGTSSGGTALGGELGTELLVRNGKWYTIGDGGAEFFRYKKDDIIFNAAQTEQLFDKGKITYGNTRGTALAHGTAFDLTGSGGGGGSVKKKKKKSKSSKSSKSENSAMDKFKDWFDKLFDWIEVRLERNAAKIEQYTKRAERWSQAGNVGKAESYYKSAISAQRSQLRDAAAGEKRYDKQAEAVLSKAMSTKNKKGKALLTKKQAADIRAKVANGTININSYSKDLQEIIKDYQNWYNKARDAAEKVEEMSAAIVDSYKAIAESYKNASESRIDLFKKKSGNATSAMSKNSELEKAAKEYDSIIDADKKAISDIQSEMNSSKSAVTGAGSVAITKAKLKTSGKGLTSKQKKANKATNKANAQKTSAAAKVAEQAKSYAKKGQAIPTNVINSLGSYVNSGFMSQSFYTSCVRYNQMLSYGPEAIQELQNQLAADTEEAKAEKRTIGSEMVENVQDEYERKLKVLEAKQNLLTTAGYEMQKKDYDSLNEMLQSEKDAIRAAIDRNVELGYWTESTPEYIDAVTNLSDIEETIQENINAIAELPYSKIEKALDVLDAIANYNESLASLKESRGKDLSESDYMIQMEDNSNKIEEFRKRASQAFTDLNKAIANGGYYAGKTSEEYKQMYNEALADVNKLLEENEELKKSMRDDVFWRTYERAHDAAQNLLDVVSGIADLISDDMYFRDGSITDFGISQIANMTKEYELARQEVENYSNDIKNLNSLLAQGFYPNQEEYNEKLAELQEGLLDSAQNMKGYIDDIISMYKNLDQNELDALFKLIDARNDALNAKKEYYDYDKTIRSKTKDIQELASQIAALEGISTAEAKAQKAKLQEQLANAQEDLQDTERDHYFNMMQDALDDMKDTLQDQFDDKWEYLSQDLTKIIELMNAANDLATENAGLVTRTLDNLLSFYGINAAETGVNKAYASGVRRVNGRVVGLSNEKGSELLVTKYGLISRFNPGDGVIPANLTERLYNLAQNIKPGSSLGKANIGKVSPGGGITINQNYDSMLNIEGSADAATVADLKRMSKDLLEKSYDYTSKRIQHDYTRTGGLRRA